MAATILVVDDDTNVRELLKLHLSAAGYEVRVAADAIAAGYLVLRSVPDLIICDINMPHMDGFEFVSALKADTTPPKLRLSVSAHPPSATPSRVTTTASRPTGGMRRGRTSPGS